MTKVEIVAHFCHITRSVEKTGLWHVVTYCMKVEIQFAALFLKLTPARRSTSTAITSSISSVPVANNASTVFDIVELDE